MASNLYLALMHYPVVNKNGETIASAVTNLDLHDISRAAKTYGVHTFYVVTPLKDQKELIEKIVSHWKKGAGAKYNPMRGAALDLIKIMGSFEEVVEHINSNNGEEIKTIVTSAKNNPRNVGYGKIRDKMEQGKHFLLLFGTGWGLVKEFVEEADYVLDPIKGDSEYNHLSVRSAVSIVLDRLKGQTD
jgi:hypothetical protein